MAQQHSHVPKFGNWDNNNVAYTAFFEDARKEKEGMRMNPNDPEQNPEAFAFANAKGWVKANDDYGKASPANSERGVGDRGRHCRSQSNGSLSLKKSPRHSGQTVGSRQASDPHRRTASIPKFGAWDETDPKSGESFTMIFDRAKEDKHSSSTHFRPIPPQQQPLSYIPGSPRKKRMATSCILKICCCFTSCGSD